MKNLRNIFLLSLFAPALLMAEGSGGGKIKQKPVQSNLAAGCAPAAEIVFLEFNNVRTRIEAGGLWWQDRANGAPDYEVPKGSNSFAIYAGGLWMGGTDVNGQLKLAASLFGSDGVDYYTGPLDIIGTAEINDSTCGVYDNFFSISRAEVAQFVSFQSAKAKGTENEDFPGYQIPNSILEWPGNGNPDNNEAFRLAPYINVGGDDSYEPEQGDYPFYDLDGDVDCRADREDRSISSSRPLFGDRTEWWIFNDKGNLHTQSNAPSIGMEIHGQAFAFATNDEVNDMTFYNFELINRSTFTLTNTYFANYVDPDLGDPRDDYVGCDVGRGLGYCYNGDDDDGDVSGRVGYGTTPAAIGIDFFEGPYQDADGLNNNVGIGPGEALNGLGYFDPTEQDPDEVPDNERFGMRRFVYYNNDRGAANGDPELAVHYYNYMRGIWKNGRVMRHGGDGFSNTSAAVEDIQTAFMFPGTSDPLHWGTVDDNGQPIIPQNQDWTEDNPGMGEDRNAPSDRRFLQSAGPFTLKPGNVNDLTIGVVFAQAQSGGRLASVEELFSADDKAQALFENCFQVLNGPDAPSVDVQELDKQLIFYLSNLESSNNDKEEYEETDPNILSLVTVSVDSVVTTTDTTAGGIIVDTTFIAGQSEREIVYDNKYRFQGYQVFQLSGPGVSVSDLDDPSKARILFQCDIRDDVADLTNYTFDKALQSTIPVKKVTAANEGIKRSFSVTEDLFSIGGGNLVNFKTYYYIAIAYGYNEYKPYKQDEAPDLLNNPFKPASDGQKIPYISSRRAGDGASIAAFTAIPHDPTFEDDGTVVNSTYGEEIGITRLQGTGNGGRALRIVNQSIDDIFALRAWEFDSISVDEINYAQGQGPFTVNVIDPLNVSEGTYYLQVTDENAFVSDTADWKLWLEGSTDTVYSEKTINFSNEQLLLDPNWGLSITIQNGVTPGSEIEGTNNGFISASVTYDEEGSEWLSGIPDSDLENSFNWILAGTNSQTQVFAGLFDDYGETISQTETDFYDPEEDFENIQQGTIAPYGLTRHARGIGGSSTPASRAAGLNGPASDPTSVELATLDLLYSAQLVFTSDRSRWTRCPVIETRDDTSQSFIKNLPKLNKLSVDKDGNTPDTTGLSHLTMEQIDSALATDNENNAAFISAFGMGWFPGYVINKETGERMNMAFGEDSRYSFNNGNDMLWNPTSTIRDGSDPRFISDVWGGKHYIYIFRKTLPIEDTRSQGRYRFLDAFMPEYDHGAKLRELLPKQGGSLNNLKRIYGWGSCTWVAVPVLQFGEELLSTDVTVDINVSKPYDTLSSNIDERYDNNAKPVYKFSTVGKGTQKKAISVLSEAIERINVVPNPYYALSEYESSQLDNTVKFTNLPQNCKITIYNTNGTLIRTYNKASPLTYLDWDLNNQVGIPISSGVYIIHIDVPGVGEKILKWFGVVRPVDLNNF